MSPAQTARLEAKQTRDLEAFLANCCDVCGVPHVEEIHEAVLRLREPVPEPVYAPSIGRKIGLKDDGVRVIRQKRLCEDCGAEYETGNARKSRRCPDCGRMAAAAVTARYNGIAARRRGESRAPAPINSPPGT